MIKYLLILCLLATPSFAALKEAKYLELQCWYPLQVKKGGLVRHYIMKVETGWIMCITKAVNLGEGGSITFIPDANHEIKWDIQ